MKRSQTAKNLVLTGMMAAALAVLSQIAVPLPTGVPVTLQTFAVALCGFVLGFPSGLLSTGIYLLLGAVGVPVFSGFKAGIGALLGVTGGFLWGFLCMAALCGAAMERRRAVSRIALSAAGLLLCHVCGAVQYAVVSGVSVPAAFLAVSLPFLLKDALSVALAYAAALAVRRGLRAARLLGNTVR